MKTHLQAKVLKRERARKSFDRTILILTAISKNSLSIVFATMVFVYIRTSAIYTDVRLPVMLIINHLHHLTAEVYLCMYSLNIIIVSHQFASMQFCVNVRLTSINYRITSLHDDTHQNVNIIIDVNISNSLLSKMWSTWIFVRIKKPVFLVQIQLFR